MITARQAIEFSHFTAAMNYAKAHAVYCARLACFCGHTLPQVDAINMRDAVRAGIVFG